MKEVKFIHNNRQKWERFSHLLEKRNNVTPDDMAQLYQEVTDDLAYANTYFPDSKTAFYLNNLAAKAHRSVHRNKKEQSNRIVNFWVYEFPLAFYANRRNFLYTCVIFVIAFLIGALSAANDSTFVRLILGDAYVNETLENIEQGDPMAIYKSARNVEMFLGITVNNVWVAFLAFTMGVFLSIGSGYILLTNGIMLGSFQYFFAQHGVLYESVTSVWIHGTLEIFAILVAGSAGLVLGNSILFPGTYKRMYSFRRGVRRGLKLVIGIVPVFVIAAFLEGFVTRYTGMPDWSRWLIIAASLWLIIWYFFIYPYNLSKKTRHSVLDNIT